MCFQLLECTPHYFNVNFKNDYLLTLKIPSNHHVKDIPISRDAIASKNINKNQITDDEPNLYLADKQTKDSLQWNLYFILTQIYLFLDRVSDIFHPKLKTRDKQ